MSVVVSVCMVSVGQAAGILTPTGSADQPVEILDHHVDVRITDGFAQTRVCCTPNGHVLVSSQDGSVLALRVSDSSLLKRHKASIHKSPIRDMARATDMLATVDMKKQLVLWRLPLPMTATT